jgi:hypothetical protein
LPCSSNRSDNVLQDKASYNGGIEPVIFCQIVQEMKLARDEVQWEVFPAIVVPLG